MKRALVILTVLLISSTVTNGQVTVDNTSMTVEQYIQNVLAGPGVIISNVTLNGNPAAMISNEQVGSFNDVNSDVGLASGVVLGSGNVTMAAQLNTGGGSSLGGTGAAGVDPDLASITPNTIFDECVVEFDFVPQGDTIQFNYVFASEEYEEYVCGTVNDAFGFFLSGNNPSGGTYNAQNLALIPDPLNPLLFTTTPVSINTVNPGVPGANGNIVNCTNIDPNFAAYNIFYTANTTNTYEYDGRTVVLQARAYVNCNQTYHIKLAIGDGGDGAFDSGVFLEAASFSSAPPVAIGFSTAATGGDSTVIEGCQSAVLNLTRSDTAGDLTIHYVISGSAINGVDYNLIADSVTYLSGIDTASITITPILDVLTEGQETIIITTTSINVCGNTITSADSMFIIDVPITTSISSDVNLNCPTDSFLISIAVTGVTEPYTYIWTDTQGNTFDNSPNIFVPALVTDTFYVTATSYCNLITVNDTVIVNVIPWFSLTTTQSDTNICDGDIVNFSTTPSLTAPYIYNWTSNISTLGTPNDSTTIGPFNTPGSDTLIVVVTDNSGTLTCVKSDTLFVNIATTPIIYTTSPDTIVCINGTATIYATPLGDTPPFSLIWDNGLVGNGPHNVNPTASSTTYNVYVLDGNNCTSNIQPVIVDLFDSIVIQALNPVRPTICEGDTTLLKAFATGGGTDLIYTWINGNGDIIGTTAINQFIITPNYDGEIFSVVVSDSCTTPADTMNVGTDWADIVFPAYLIDSNVFCYNQFHPTFTNITATTSTITNIQWDFGDGDIIDLPFSYQINHTYNNPGIYDIKLTVTDQTGCVWDTIMDGIQINAHSYPTAEFFWSPNPTDYLNALITFDNQSTENLYNQWVFITNAQYTSNDIDPVFQFPQDQPGNYDVTLKVTNEIGCQTSVSKIVIIDDVFVFYIPTAFTPNGDGLNDTFKIVGEGIDLNSFKMTVFNKWGQLVFESNNPDIGWDGTQNGALVPDGVYIWKIDAKEAHSPIVHNKNGFISIVK